MAKICYIEISRLQSECVRSVYVYIHAWWHVCLCGVCVCVWCVCVCVCYTVYLCVYACLVYMVCVVCYVYVCVCCSMLVCVSAVRNNTGIIFSLITISISMEMYMYTVNYSELLLLQHFTLQRWFRSEAV